VLLPTETVYGLACDAGNSEAVAKVFAAKGRPRFNPLIAHVTGVEAAKRLAVLDARALALAEAFWPGPLTLVAPIREAAEVCDLARAGLVGRAGAKRCDPRVRAGRHGPEDAHRLG